MKGDRGGIWPYVGIAIIVILILACCLFGHRLLFG